MANENEKEATTENTAVATNNDRFAKVANLANLEETMGDEFAGVQVSLDRIPFPTGGGTSFQKPTLEGVKDLKTLDGVIVFNHPAYSYYKNAYDGSKNPPDCSSLDGKLGVGTPGGPCSKCPLNAFGSSTDGNSKACKNKRVLYFLTKDDPFPFIIYIPVGSIGNYNQFAKQCMGANKQPSELFVSISLEKATSKNGIPFSKATINVKGFLTDEENKKIQPVKEFAKNYAASRADAIIRDAQDDPLDGFTNVDTETGEKLK